MSAKHTISINGQLYDAVTGLRLDAASNEPEQIVASAPVEQKTVDVHREPVRPSVSIHQQLHKSSTLRRSHLTAPVYTAPVSAPKHHALGHVAQSPMISHFASHPKPLPKHRPGKMINDIGPAVRRPIATPEIKQQLASKEVKERLIAKAGLEVDRSFSTAAKHAKPKKASLLKKIRKQHIVAAGIAAFLLVGYVTYLNVPGLSVRVAAIQAGVNAKYPDYNPDGYSFQGPVAFEQGEVELHFKANGGGEGYTIVQRNSDWNSVAVRDNLVTKDPDTNYDANSVGGIIVYTYSTDGTNGTNAAWTNGGILYTVEGNAPLGSDQLLKIASSM